MADTYVCSGWACTDCLFWLANGDLPSELNEEEAHKWVADVQARNDGYDVTLGMLREDHACATNYTVTDATGEYEYRADSEEDARQQHDFKFPDVLIISVTAHELQTDQDRGGDCECEQVTFTWSPCDVCGSNLGGARDAVSFFKRGTD